MKCDRMILRGVVLAVAMSFLAACSYSHTTVEKPAAAAPDTVVVPEQSHTTIVVPPSN